MRVLLPQPQDTDILLPQNTLYRVSQEPKRVCFTITNPWTTYCKCVWYLRGWMLSGHSSSYGEVKDPNSNLDSA